MTTDAIRESLAQQVAALKAENEALRSDAERYATVRELAMLGNYGDLRAIISSDGNEQFDAKVDILKQERK